MYAATDDSASPRSPHRLVRRSNAPHRVDDEIACFDRPCIRSSVSVRNMFSDRLDRASRCERLSCASTVEQSRSRSRDSARSSSSTKCSLLRSTPNARARRRAIRCRRASWGRRGFSPLVTAWEMTAWRFSFSRSISRRCSATSASILAVSRSRNAAMQRLLVDRRKRQSAVIECPACQIVLCVDSMLSRVDSPCIDIETYAGTPATSADCRPNSRNRWVVAMSMPHDRMHETDGCRSMTASRYRS